LPPALSAVRLSLPYGVHADWAMIFTSMKADLGTVLTFYLVHPRSSGEDSPNTFSHFKHLEGSRSTQKAFTFALIDEVYPPY
jgi:hypothetical protein